MLLRGWQMNGFRAALAAACLLVPAFPATAADAPPITRYTLDNGLDVVLAPDRHVPKVVFNLSYRVGAMNEPAGRSGFAHLFEHLMFSGTDAYPNMDHTYSAVGVNINAWTWDDKTLYYAEGLSSTLPLMLSLEADRMANLGRSVDQRELDIQRAVVKNEMRQNVIDAPFATGWEVAWTAVYPKPHPYGRTVLGSLADLNDASLDDVQGFFNTYYVPNNAILVLTGDFDVADAKALVEQTFGLVPRGAEVVRPEIALPAPAKVRLEFEDKVPSADVGLIFAGPRFDAPEGGALAIAAELLGNSEYGMLRERLVATGQVTYAAAEWVPSYLGGRFYVEAGGSDETEPGAIEAELRQALADLAAGPIDATDVERAKNALLLRARLAREPLQERTELIAQMTDMFGDPARAFADDPRIAAATAEDVRNVVRTVLDVENASVLVIKPGQRGGYPAVFTESSGKPEPFTATPRPVVAVPPLAAREPAVAERPKMETAALSNGMAIVHYAAPDAPMAYIAALGKGGWPNAPAGKEGLLDMAVGMAYRGAGDRDYASFAKAASDIGAGVGTKSGYQGMMVTLGVPRENLSAGVALFADALRRPRFDESEWKIAAAEALDGLAQREADLPDVAARAATARLFPTQPGKAAMDWSAETLRAMTLDDARAAYATLFRPAGITFYSVGPEPVETVKAELEKAFGDWKEAGDTFTPEGWPPATLPAGRKVLLVPEPGASQSALYVARAAPGYEEPNFSESIAVLRLLGDDFTSRLNSVIREEKGFSYGVYGDVLTDVATGSLMAIKTTVERDNTGPALAEYFTGFDSLVTRPVEQVELDRTITAYQTSLAGVAETAGGLFDAVTGWAGNGRTLDDRFRTSEAVIGLTLEPVQAQGVALASLDNALIVVAGDPDVVLPQLKAIGIGDVEIVERATPTSRDAVLDGDNAPEAVEPPLTRARGTTKGVHVCGDDDADACRP